MTAPLPKPPQGKEWHYDHETKEWSIVEKHTIENNRSPTEAHSSLFASPYSDSSADSALFGSTDAADNANLENGTDADDDLLATDVDYVEHKVLPSDTFQGICIAYNISASKLRQTNCFSGEVRERETFFRSVKATSPARISAQGLACIRLSPFAVRGAKPFQ